MADRRSLPVLRPPRRRVPGRQRGAGPARPRSRAATSAWTSRARTAGACTTATWCRASRSHPHRGFETVTIVRRGFIDHSDSLGRDRALRPRRRAVADRRAAASCTREMFPLLERDAGNPLELFQIWLNLPRADKMVDPHFSMLWSDSIPRHVVARRARARRREVTVIAGALAGRAAPAPPPRLVGRARRHRRRDLDDHAGAGRALHAAAGRARARRAHALLLPRRQPARRPATSEASHAGLEVRRRRGESLLETRPERERAPAAAGPPDRRAGGAARPVRDEHARRRSSRPSPTTSARSSAAGRGRATTRCTRATRAASPDHADGRREEPR